MIEPNPNTQQDIKDMLKDLKNRIDRINPLIRDINIIFNQLDCAINWDIKVKEQKIQDIINGQNVFLPWSKYKLTATEYESYIIKLIYGNPETWRCHFEQNFNPQEKGLDNDNN